MQSAFYIFCHLLQTLLHVSYEKTKGSQMHVLVCRQQLFNGHDLQVGLRTHTVQDEGAFIESLHPFLIRLHKSAGRPKELILVLVLRELFDIGPAIN